MKKLLTYLLLLPMLGFFTACDDPDDDLPEVDIRVEMSGATKNAEDGTYHVAQGTPLVIKSITVESRNDKDAMLGPTTYYLNGDPIWETNLPPYSAVINTSRLVPGRHYRLQIRTTVLQVDKPISTCVLSYRLTIDPPAENPDDSEDSDELPTLTIIHSGEGAFSED